MFILRVNAYASIDCDYDSAGTVAVTRTSVMASGPVGLTIVRIGAIAMSAGAILRPCMHAKITDSGFILRVIRIS